MSDVFGPILSGADVEDAVKSALETWLPTYLRAVERKKDIPADSLQPIASTVPVNEFSQVQGQPLPCAIIVCPGTEGSFERDGDGTYRCWWTVGIAVIVEAVNDVAARRLAQLYGAAILTMVVQQPDLGDVASAIVPGLVTGEDAPANLLSGGVAVCRVVFSVLTEGVVTALAGPTEPDPDPAPWPEVHTVHIDAERLTE